MVQKFGRDRSEADMPRASGAGDLTEMTDTVEKVSAKKLWNWNLKRSNPGKWIAHLRLVLNQCCSVTPLKILFNSIDPTRT
jgi:hypothetical protein